MSIKFIDELTPGTDYCIFDRKTSMLTVDSTADPIVASVEYTEKEVVKFLKIKISESPYAQTYRKPRYIFEGDDGTGMGLMEEFTLTGKEDYLFIEV